MNKTIVPLAALSQGPLRLETVPKELSMELSYELFEVKYGLMEWEKRTVIVAVYRRKGTSHPYEPVGAAFIAEHIMPHVSAAHALLTEDDEVRQAIEKLALAMPPADIGHVRYGGVEDHPHDPS